MDIGNIAGNALGGAVGGAAAGLLIGFAMHKGIKLDKKLALTGAGVFAGLAVISTALGKDIPLVPRTHRFGVAGPIVNYPRTLSEAQQMSQSGVWGPWYAPNYYW